MDLIKGNLGMRSLDRLVILSVSAGTGHMRAAQALQKAAEEQFPSVKVTILDTFRYASPFWEKMILGVYMEMLKNAPQLYGYLYRRAEKGQALSGLAKGEFNRILNRITASKLLKFLQEENPRAVICTHPFPLGVLAELKRKREIDFPILAAITDFTVHSFWLFPEVDYYLVASDKLIPEFVDYGVDINRVKATGIPIDPYFSIQKNKTSLKEQYGLDFNIPTVLVVGGGLGMGPMEQVVRELGNSLCKMQILVVTGTNQALRQKLQTISGTLANPVRVLGFVNDMHNLMGASDLLVGKAGGLTCAEAMAMGLPVFIINPIPGQEERNVEFLQGQGAALRVKEGSISCEVGNYFKLPGIQEKMCAAASRLGKGNSASNSISLIQRIIENEAGSMTV